MFTINNEQWYIVLVMPNDPVLWMPWGGYALGACCDITKSIYISNALHGAEFESVLCHEIVHACARSYDLEFDIQTEELLAEIISIFGEEIIDITDAMFERIRRGRY